MSRSFVDSPAVRSRVPLLFGLIGPSGGGKTYSALALATGISKVIGKEVFCVDTEAKRALHYADDFKFRHIPFDPPFGSLDYLEVIRYCASKGAGVVVIDSMSHEHEGQGGYLDTHEAEVKRLCEKGGFRSEFAAQVPAWAAPAAARSKLINGVIQMGVNAIFCFRAKERVDLNGKGDNGKATVTKLGWMPIAGAAFVYEMTARCLLPPGANGVPDWTPDAPGEKALIKLPKFFAPIFAKPEPLSEKHGEAMARWAAGTAAGTAKASPAPDPDGDAEREAVRSEGNLDDSSATLAAEVAEFWIEECHKVETIPALAALKKRLTDAELPEHVRALIRGPLAQATKRAGR